MPRDDRQVMQCADTGSILGEHVLSAQMQPKNSKYCICSINRSLSTCLYRSYYILATLSEGEQWDASMFSRLKKLAIMSIGLWIRGCADSSSHWLDRFVYCVKAGP